MGKNEEKKESLAKRDGDQKDAGKNEKSLAKRGDQKNAEEKKSSQKDVKMEVSKKDSRNKALDKRGNSWQETGHGIWLQEAPSSSTSGITLAKSEQPVPEPTGPKWVLKANKQSRVAIDYHQCLEIQEHVPPKNVAALHGLAANGYQVFLVSYAGQEKQVREDLTKVQFNFTGLKFTRNRCGPHGKGYWCQQMGIGHIFDDNQYILQECQLLGMEVWPIMTRWENHPWSEKKYGCLWKAVEDFLIQQALKD